ncbi:DUF2442 domain-containing protein [Agathobaculum desmolans]|uniref:DUF2442 domain-containing protein n=1 Tax=Agathobaculum desmolans TaxID=39484 RepID=UPI00248DAF1A|nr:DUF2442 domain-containing protein [Agathobaculum desmolans]
METTMLPAIVQVLPGDDFTVYAYCNDGAVRLLDAKPLLELGGIFESLKDPAFFRERLTVMNDTVAWDIKGNRDETCCIDLDPCVIFRTAPIVDDPLENVI